MPHPNINLESKLKWLSQITIQVPDLNRDGKVDKNDNMIACAYTCNQILINAGFKTQAGVKTDIAIWDANHNIVKAATWQAGVDLVHDSFNNGLPVMAGVNRSDKSVGNINSCTSHFILLIGRYFNPITEKYEYRFYDVGTSHLNLGTSPTNIITLGANGLWVGKSAYMEAMSVHQPYVVTEVRKVVVA